jgi:hypothetical protein
VAGGRLQPDAIRTNAERFSIDAFKANFQAAVDETRGLEG